MASTRSDRVKILVTIPNYGTHHDAYLTRIIDEYRVMPWDIDVVVFCEGVKDFGKDVRVYAPLHSVHPTSLPFSDRRYVADRLNDYDVFIHSDDDVLITQRNIQAFIDCDGCATLPLVPGFFVKEVAANGSENFPQVHAQFKWDGEVTVGPFGTVFAYFSNVHSACNILTRGQLAHAIASGGYLVPPHGGETYAVLESGATDVYSQCGLRKMICISHFDDFVVHHLPGNYIGCLGVSREVIMKQIEGLLAAVSA